MNITEAIKTIIDSTLSKMQFAINTKSYSDKTFTARIVTGIKANKYKIMYCGNEYTVSSTVSCSAGDFVRVCAPCNNWQDLFVIENKTQGTR